MVAGAGHPFGSLLKRYRRAQALTQEQPAVQAGFNPNYISMLERGVRPPNQAAVDRLASVLELGRTERAAFQMAAQTPEVTPGVSPFGNLLREFRLAAGLTQEQLAERINLSARTVSDLERGPKSAPRRDTVELLIEALDLSPEQRAALESVVPRPHVDVAAELGSRSLPTMSTPLIGREQAEAEAVHFLRREGCRLLTLTGTGGVGKTRLALRVATAIQGEYEDGVVFVPLAPVHDHALVLPSIAAVLGLQEGGRRSLDQIIASYLRDRHLLLLLDNFEHLLDAAPVVSDLLGRCPHLRALVTSRAPLRLREEQEFEVQPLDLPGDDHAPAADLGHVPAVALFVQRAQASKPEFRVTDGNARSIAAICRKVDGLPLAIELAAGWIRVFSPEEILQRLDHGLQLLTEGSRDLPDRQRTMRDTIAWSYYLLPPESQILLHSLSVFSGGCTLEAAESVCPCVDGGSEIVKALKLLVDHRLVTVNADGGTRYGLLEMVREFGQERLEESGQAGAARQAHALYFLSLADAAASQLSGPRQAGWLLRLRAESDNFRTALAWWLHPVSGRPRSAEQAVILATALWRFWYEQGNWTEGRAWLQRALDAGEEVTVPTRARALNTAGMAALFQGEYAEGGRLLAESLGLFQQLGSKHGEASAITYLGYLAAGELEAPRTRELLGKAAALLPHLTHPWIAAYLVSFLGLGHSSLGEAGQAVAFLEDAVSRFRTLGDTRGMRQCLALLGFTLFSAGDLPGAREAFRESLRLSRPSRDVLVLYFSLLGLASMASLEERPHRSTVLWGAADRLRHAHGLDLSLFVRKAIRYDEIVGATRERLGEATFAETWEDGRAIQLNQAIEYALEEGE